MTGDGAAASSVAVTVTACSPSVSPIVPGSTDSASGRTWSSSLMARRSGLESSSPTAGSVPGSRPVQWPSTTSASRSSATASSTTRSSLPCVRQPFAARSRLRFGNVTSAGDCASLPAARRRPQPV